MANQPEINQYDATIYQLESTDPVDGGVGAVSNKPLLGLANRTNNLNKRLSDVESGTTLIDVYAPKNSPALTGTPTAPNQAAGDNSTKIANTAFVQAAVNGQVSVSIAGNTNTTLTVAQYGVSTVILTGAVTGNKAVIFPALSGRWLVINRATGAFTVTCRTASGTGVVINQGASNAIFCDGTNIGVDQTDFISPALTGTPTAPTPANSDISQQIATSAFVRNVMSMLGLGDTSLSATIADFNDANVASGIYWASTSATNNPIAGTQGLLIHKVAGGAGLQIYSVYNMDRVLWRRRTSSVWGQWNEFANLDSPAFTGNPTAPTPALGDNDTSIATTAFVQAAMAAFGIGSSSTKAGVDLNTLTNGGIYYCINATNGPIVAAGATINGYIIVAQYADGATYGMQMFVPTAGAGADYNSMYFRRRIGSNWGAWTQSANIDSPAFTGTPTAPTQDVGDNSTRLATTAHLRNTLNNFGLGAYNTGAIPATQAELATIPSGNYYYPSVITPYPLFAFVQRTTYGTNKGFEIANVPYTDRLFLRASNNDGTWRAPVEMSPLDSPALTGTPTAPTAAANTNTTQLATTAFVLNQAATAAPQPLGAAAAVGNGTRYARENHVHAVPTLDALSNVTITANSNGEILRWNGTAWVNNTLAEAGIAPVASPALTGTPTAPKAAQFATGSQIINADALKASGVQFSGVRTVNLSVATDTLTLADVGGLYIITGSGGGTVTLPKANTVPAGGRITIRANNTSVSTNVVAAASGDTLTGALQSTAPAGTLRSGDSVTVVSDGVSTWHVVADATYNFTTQAVARWFVSNQSLADIGYQKLPSGLIIQWGVAPTTTTSSAVTFPTAFPTKCGYVGSHDQNSAGATSMSLFQVTGLTLTGFTAVNVASITRGSTTVNAVTSASRPWFAIGY